MERIRKKAYKKIIKQKSSQKSNVQTKKYLLDALSNPDLPKKEAKKILKFACECDREDVVDSLLTDGVVDVDDLDENGQTALFYATRSGSTDCFNLLLKKNINVKANDNDGKSALTYAIDVNNFHFVSKIIKNVNIDELIQGAIQHVIHRKNSEALAILADYENVDLHLFSGETGFLDKRQYTALHYASKRGFTRAVDKLISSGNRIILRNKSFTFNWLLYSPVTNVAGNEIKDLLRTFKEQQETTEETEELHIICINGREHLELFDVFKLPLKHMTLINSNLKQIPYFNGLVRLALSCCTVENFEFLGDFRLLEVLSVSDCGLAAFPDSLQNCGNLRRLNVCHNESLELIPSWIMSLPLEFLAVNDNSITELPELLPKTLRVLLLQNNRVKRLSPLLARLTDLSHVSLHGNPLVFPELSICKSKTKDLLAYLKAFLSNTVPNDTVKISLVGQERVGKSTLLEAIKSPAGICNDIGGVVKTDGLEISNVAIRDLNFRIFDLAGDLDFIETHTMFISEGTIFLAVFDLRMYSLNSLNSYAFSRVEIWLSSIYAQAPNSRVILVGTHADGEMISASLLESTWQSIKTLLESGRVKHREVFSNNPLHQCLLCSTSSMVRKSNDGAAGYVKLESPATENTPPKQIFVPDGGDHSNEEGGGIVFPHIVGYYEVSNLKKIPRKVFSSKNTSMEQLKDCLYSVALDMVSQNPRVPRKWTNLRNVLNKKVEKHFPVISYQEFVELACECGIDQSDDEVDPFLRHYNSCGELLYYFDIDELCDVIIIDPQWLSNQLRSVISFRATDLVSDGVITHACLESAWSQVESLYRHKVLSLFRQAGIFIPFSDTSDLVPCRLPIGRPSDDIWAPSSHTTELQVNYSFKFNNLPPSFFSHLTSLVESKRDVFSAGKMAPVYYSNHIVYITKSTGIPCDVHTATRQSVNLSPVESAQDASQLLSGGVPLMRFLSLEASSVDNLLDAGRNSFRVSVCENTDFNELSINNDGERDKQPNSITKKRHRVHFELLPHLKIINISIRGPTPCCLAPETIDLINRVRLTRYNAIQSEFYIICPVCIRKGVPNPSKFDVTDVSQSEPICEKGHDLKSWESVLTGQCDFIPVLSSEQIVLNMSDYDCPKLFLMMPVNLHGVGFREFYTLTYLKEGYSVHLLCEFPECWHFLSSPGYRLNRPKDFVRRYGRRLQTLLRVLAKLEIPARFAGLVSETANNVADLCQAMEKMATDLDEHLSDFSEQWSNFNTTRSLEQDVQFLKSNDGMNRREFRRFLNKADEEQRFGDLIPTFVDGRVLWLCDVHHKQHQVSASC